MTIEAKTLSFTCAVAALLCGCIIQPDDDDNGTSDPTMGQETGDADRASGDGLVGDEYRGWLHVRGRGRVRLVFGELLDGGSSVRRRAGVM